ncbi:MAG: hypothetical protein JSS38_10970 [Nitrospira sp.]|nr:hypothetical protein [Nitrospira sp.]
MRRSRPTKWIIPSVNGNQLTSGMCGHPPSVLTSVSQLADESSMVPGLWRLLLPVSNISRWGKVHLGTGKLPAGFWRLPRPKNRTRLGLKALLAGRAEGR